MQQAEPVDQSGEPLAIFGKVDRIGAGAEDRNALVRQRLRQFERRLPAELDDHPDQRARLLFDPENFQHILAGQRLEIEPVRGVIVGAHRFRIAIDHDGFEPGIGQRIAGVDAAIIELDPLPDAVGPAAEDNDFTPV